jgi:SAM-dependent methyltransferase
METVYLVFVIIVMCFGVGAVLGAPFLPVRRPDMEAALDLADVRAGQTIIDLGSGDGRLLLAAARRGATAIGYEINPLLVMWSRLATWRYRRQVKVRFGDFWSRRLPVADVIYVFIITHHTDRLDKKLRSQLQRPTRVVSYVFELPRQPVASTHNTYLYMYP